MNQKASLIELLRRGYEQNMRFYETLTDEERRAGGSLEHWSAKDTLGHIVAWNEKMVQRLEAAARGEDTPAVQDVDGANAELYALFQPLTWEELLAKMDQVNQALLGRVQALAEDELRASDRYSWQSGQPVWRRIAGNGFLHPQAHLTQYYFEHGRGALADQMNEKDLPLLRELDDSADWQGTVLYNMACFHSLSGRVEQALDGLRQAFSLRPDLAEYSKGDTDLDPIRQQPAYQELIQSKP